jgi:hypothetical protein
MEEMFCGGDDDDLMMLSPKNPYNSCGGGGGGSRIHKILSFNISYSVLEPAQPTPNTTAPLNVAAAFRV